MEAQPLLTAYAKFTVAKRFQSPMAEILHEVQVHHVFPDSKEFVDMPMKHDPQVICESWRKLMSREDTTALNKEVLHRFVEEHFAPPGSDTVQCTTFSDYTHNPAFLSKITDSAFRDWAQTLNDLWPIFGRRTADDVSIHPERYTLFPQRNPFLVPGGRFREFYYWDSFWIIKGLLLSEMVQTARGIIENMVDMVDRFGFVPNGSRSYYLNRSQPPLLCEMVHAYYHTTKDSEFVRQVVGTLEKEYAFWMSTNDKTGGHAVEIKGKDNAIYTLNRYTVKVTEPRPESYREDLQLAIDLGLSPEQAPEIYGEIAAACESGWDFTSRWFKDQHHLNTIHIRDLLPVDLNSILYKYETNLAEFFADVMKDDERASVYRQKADTRKAAMRLFLWDAEEGQWFDYDIKENAKKLIVSVSNFFPLWAGAYDADQVQPSVKAILNSQLVQHGGLVGTCLYTHQQWDFPNGWPPLQWFLVEALRNANTEESKALAEDVAVKWLYNNYAGFELSGGKMYEKYDVRVWGFRGFGGEYEPQDGFGWSNGVCLCLLDLYGKSMTYEAFKQMRPLDEKGSMQEIKSMFTITKGDMRYIVRMMNKDMNRGLKKEGVSAMRMAPTFVTRCPRGGEEGVGYAMHLGKGLDLRLFRVEKQAAENGLGKTTQKVIPIPPELIRGKGTELFDFMANQLKAFIIESADMERTCPIPLNFIFGFPIEQTALDKARLVKWIKGFSASGVEGEDVMELLRDALRRADMQSTVKVVGLVNDSVGTLVAGLASETNCIMGAIVGTGTNLSYYEQVKRIKKLKHFYEACPLSCPKEMIVNMEWARFGDGSDVLPVNMFDKMLDANSSNPGEHTLEKMTSGMYLGELARCVIMHLMEKKVIRKIKGFERRGAITVDHLARMMDDNSADLDDVKRFLKESFQFISLPNERKDMRKVATWVTLRACRLIASGIGAVAYRRGVVEDATVSTDGSVLERTQQVFFRTVQAALKEIFATNIHVNMVFNKDSAGRGAAMIALLES